MPERIVGMIFLMTSGGDCDHDVDVLMGTRHHVEGQFGSVVIDTTVRPARIHGKGNVYLNFGQGRTRSGRLDVGQTVAVELVDGFRAGSLTFKAASEEGREGRR